MKPRDRVSLAEEFIYWNRGLRANLAVAAMAAFALILVAGTANAAPIVSQTLGRFDHKAIVTINGSGFGTKTTAAPIVWDDASGANILDKWSGAWPDASGPNGPASQTIYRVPQRGISLPHSNITRYIAGCHRDSGGANAGYDVMFWKTRTIALPSITYMSWYQRVDDAWVFGLGSPADDNFKIFDYSRGTDPFDASNWYIAYNDGPHNRSALTDYIVNDDDDGVTRSIISPDVNGNNAYWEIKSINPMAGTWAKIEVEVKHSSQNDGFINLRENGILKIYYVGPTDKYAGSIRSMAIGGYSRGYGNANQWRYFADAYLDDTLARVVLANSPTLSTASIVEVQIPTAWSASSISASVNLGKFTPGQTAYLFVVDSAGTPSTVGTRVTVGAPSAPANLVVQ